MNAVLQMNLKIIDAHLWTGCVEFSRTILALDARIIHVFDIFWGRGVGSDGDGEVSNGADGCVAHCSLKVVVGVVEFKLGESSVEP